MHHDLQSLMEKYKEMEQLLTSTNLPYNLKIMVVPIPPKFKVPSIKMYDRTKDLVEHLETFKTHMTLHRFLSEITCRAFPLTLIEPIQGWSDALQLGSIDNFEELGRKILTQFMAS